jgi:hypothetical protein
MSCKIELDRDDRDSDVYEITEKREKYSNWVEKEKASI